ncbi:PGN_0703 family putative restriction endonuclease [Pimelobacter simplex]|uniref:PGN_0703 family putative restriction endonuclease n=1 Tax=Nocardioides simplex TaxID=2045 RepID=UPI00214FF868|nr:hypothetical protein [Pimelobacter simplex]UUW92959.1 hypothetical protein M0M43_30105 [Pimelobacter simplex]UUW98992.1 hypothetical protein M0M48_30125 [Pimelobacter simplex]
MSVIDPSLSWNDSAWLEAADNKWQAQLRRQQAWWRQERLGLPAGPRVGDARLVSSMLPGDVDLSTNLMSPEAVDAAEHALQALRTEGRPGLIQEERLRRNLLSSQPLCFNLFGYLGAHRHALLPWVRTIQPEATSVEDIRLEWAPATGTLGGSAFDAFVSYETRGGNRGFIGIEVKYAEDLAAAQRKPANDKYKAPTLTGLWKTGAIERLDQPRLRQFWYNQLLTQVVLGSGDYDEGFGAVVACAADHSAREVTAAVAAELTEPAGLRFSSIEDVVASVRGHVHWQTGFTERYLTYAQRA